MVSATSARSLPKTLHGPQATSGRADGSTYMITLMHVGIPEDIDADLDGLAEVARSFRFE
jgi:hypothetical protein